MVEIFPEPLLIILVPITNRAIGIRLKNNIALALWLGSGMLKIPMLVKAVAAAINIANPDLPIISVLLLKPMANTIVSMPPIIIAELNSPAVFSPSCPNLLRLDIVRLPNSNELVISNNVIIAGISRDAIIPAPREIFPEYSVLFNILIP